MVKKMAEQKPVKIMETVLRDAHQSLIATRMPTEMMLPIVEKMDKVGYHLLNLLRHTGPILHGISITQRIGKRYL